ncbi:hypothetical protein PY092_12850 [Muricauda sp. 334s03]|uniref:TerB family tellurite resistance protein n=2 Tax=Flagellimonas TaxID=444459 RepID=A0ABT5XQ63_9FLAO|nr:MULTISPECIES: hypothetical protein [Allomuricauda]MDF0707726.1 hypothetical protein [[Muricauda] okinawensis]MDF0717044.1 hypothetical protein [[Muricauda] yonaguniensis]
MEVVNLLEYNEHKNRIAHFASIVRLVTKDGSVDPQEEKVIRRLSEKMDIKPEDYRRIVAHPEKYVPTPAKGVEERLEGIYTLFRTVYTEHYMNDQEQKLVLRYAVELGYSEEKAKEILENSVRIFTSKLSSKEYRMLIQG